MRLNGKDKVKGQKDNKMKIYNDYIYLIRFSTAAMGLILPLRVFFNWIATTKSPKVNRL